MNVKSKRKPVLPSKNLINRTASLHQLHIEDMCLSAGKHRNVYFKRLRYFGCPELQRGTVNFPANITLTNMNRDSFIREIYELLAPDFNITKFNTFGVVLKYLAWLDTSGIAVKDGKYLSKTLIAEYMNQWGDWFKKGRYSQGSWRCVVSAFRWILEQKEMLDSAKALPVLRDSRNSIKGHKALNLEGELKPVAKALIKAFNELVGHFVNDTNPRIHPLFDEALFNAEMKRIGEKKIGYKKGAFILAVVRGDWVNQMTRLALMLCYMWTGINTSSLMLIKRKDLKYKAVSGGQYILESVKGRAGHQEQDNSLGFSKYAKSFLDKWDAIAGDITSHEPEAFLFPYRSTSGEFYSFAEISDPPQKSINKLLKLLGLMELTPSTLRKTKLDTLMRATDSVYLVAMSANNTLETIGRSYSSGVESDHENNLGASIEAKFNIAKGTDIKVATEEAKFKYGDVLSDYEYQKLRKGKDRSHEARTPLGVRCNDSTKGAVRLIKKSLTRAGVEADSIEPACTDFLGCFECEQHALVADIQDIWLMLSFKDTLQEMQQLPSINSFPENKYNKLYQTINGILQRFKEKSKENFEQALEKHKSEVHPLYSSVYSLNDLLEVFA
jgi:hypothetical protein